MSEVKSAPELEEILTKVKIPGEIQLALAEIEAGLKKQESDQTKANNEPRLTLYDFDSEFGRRIDLEAKKLADSGIDPNQIASALVKKFDLRNYGIGILLGEGQTPMTESPTLRRLIISEVLQNGESNYAKNSPEVMERIKNNILRWLQIPEEYQADFIFATASDGGTGSGQTCVQTLLQANPKISKIALEKKGWPGHKAMAASQRVDLNEKEIGFVAKSEVLPAYQIGPHNQTGIVHPTGLWQQRAKTAAKNKQMVFLDHAYPGFAHAYQLLKDKPYTQIMEADYKRFIAPFLEKGVTTAISVGPTKAFRTFKNRPGGLSLIYCPDQNIKKILAGVIRARGSAFENTSTRALLHGLDRYMSYFTADHEISLRRVAGAEDQWRKYSKDTPLAKLFVAGEFAGIFRNFTSKEGAARTLYGHRLGPVASNGNIRINTTGLPGNKEIAKADVTAFASVMADD